MDKRISLEEFRRDFAKKQYKNLNYRLKSVVAQKDVTFAQKEFF